MPPVSDKDRESKYRAEMYTKQKPVERKSRFDVSFFSQSVYPTKYDNKHNFCIHKPS